MTALQPLHKLTALSLLSSEPTTLAPTEEQLHPWSIKRLEGFETPFLRTWDDKSGSQPFDKKRMMSRAPRQRLDTLESRKTSLTIHINHKDWTPTPYISFTTSDTGVQDLASFRSRRRGKQTITVINPNVRWRLGLPILEVAAEMDHYGIQDPYGKSNQYYIDHYVCL